MAIHFTIMPTMIPTLLLLLVPIPSGETVITHDFACITSSLDGHRARFRIILESTAEPCGNFLMYDCQSDNAVNRAVLLPKSTDAHRTMVVDATLRVIRHPASVGDGGTPFRAFTEFRLVDAVVQLEK
jgi:hypothetical protein